MTDVSAVPLAVGYPTTGLVAAVAVGLLAGVATYALVVVADLSDAPPRRIAATLARRPADSLSTVAVGASHLAWAVAVLLAVWAGGLALGGLGTDLPSVGVAVAVLVASWWLLTGPLPSERDRPLGDDGGAGRGAHDSATVRREWALVHAAFALSAVLAFLPVYYVLLRFVFPPSG